MYSRICIVICNYNFTLSKNSKSCCTVIGYVLGHESLELIFCVPGLFLTMGSQLYKCPLGLFVPSTI